MNTSSRFFWDLYARGYDSLRCLRPYRDMHCDVLSTLTLSRGERWLEAGCGTGSLLAAVNTGGLFGIDFSPAMLRQAAASNTGGRFICAQLDRRLPLRDSCIDAVTCVNVLYALPDSTQTLAEFYRVLRPRGLLTLVNPKSSVSPCRIAWEHLFRASWSSRLALLMRLPSLFWVSLCNCVLLSSGGRQRLYLPSAEELVALLDRNGFTSLRVTETYARQAWLISGVRR